MGSIRLFKLFGIKLELHFTFVLLLLWFALEGYGYGGLGLLGSALFAAAVILAFVCVVLHELGHALAARRYGIPTRRILLMPIGGVAQLSHIPREPKQELVISIAGPAVNAVLLAVLYPLQIYVIQEDTLPSMLVEYLILINKIMLLFNLLPAFPMDGGRMLRAALVYKFSYLKATGIAVQIGRVAAIGGIVYALTAYDPANWLLVILFVFILLSGAAEYKLVQREAEWQRWVDDESQ